MKYQLTGHSSLGSRPTNQDRIAHVERDNAVLLALADGLGGHTGGELAAEGLIQTAMRAFERIKHATITQPSAFLALTILQAHNAIVQYARSRPDDVHPRTTCVLCLVQNGYAYWAHVGDSRLYHFRAGKLRTRTHDHTATERLREDGVISEEEMHTHPEKSRLLKCIGGPHKPTISLGEETPLQRGDTLLLCSDGLWEAFSAEELAAYVELGALDEAIEEMVMEAENRRKGACDNVSAVCLRWEDNAPRSSPLQANPALNLDQDALWEIAKNKLLAQRALSKKAQSTRGASKSTRSERRVGKKRSFRSELEELEKYIKQFE